MKYVLFTDESRATLDGPDGWAKGWAINGDQAPVRRRRQQGARGGGVMTWAEIIGDELIDLVRVPQGIKFSSATYCQFLKNALETWLEEVPLTRLKKVVFMHDNAPCHAAKATIKCLEGLGFKDKALMVWPPNSPDINPIENLWAIIKQRVYADGRQFSTLPELWKAIQLESAAIPHSLVKKLTDSVNERLFDVIRCQGGGFVNK